MHSLVIPLSLNTTHTSNGCMCFVPLPSPRKNPSPLEDQAHSRTGNMSLLSIRYSATISVNQHTAVHRTEIHTTHVFFSTSLILFYHYVNLFPVNYVTASETELPYLSIENMVLISTLSSKIYYMRLSTKGRECIIFSMLVKLGSSWSIKCQ